MWRSLRNWRILTTAVVVLTIFGVALWPAAIEVDVTQAQRGPLQVTIDEEGQTRVRERFQVSAPVAGRLQRIELEPGDPVMRGHTVLARINPAQPTLLDARMQAELTAAVESARAAEGQARAERARAAAALARAQSSLRRQQELADSGTISRDDLEVAQTALMTAEEAVKAAGFNVSRTEYDLQVARARLQQPSAAGRPVEIVSPIDGVVLKRMRESEAVVPAGEPLIEVDFRLPPERGSGFALIEPVGRRQLFGEESRDRRVVFTMQPLPRSFDHAARGPGHRGGDAEPRRLESGG